MANADDAGALAPDGELGAPRDLQLVQRVLLALPVAGILVLGFRHRWMSEDGFIYLRIVRHIEAGNGPVFNAGERVETYTGTVWVVLLWALDLITPIRLEWISILLGLVMTALGVAFAIAGSRRLWASEAAHSLYVPLGGAAFVGLYPTWVFASSGLETGLVFGWLGASLFFLAGWARNRGEVMPVWQIAIVGLGWLIRPEMVVFSGLFLVMLVALDWRTSGWRERGRVVVGAVGLPVAYQIFRMGYFGEVVANTAIAKEGSRSNWSRGASYFMDLAEPYWLWVPLLGLVAGGLVPLVATLKGRNDMRRLAVVSVFVLGAVVNTVFVIGVGGDYHHARMFLPAFMALCAPIAVVPATRAHLAGVAVIVWAIVGAFVLRPEQLSEGNWLANGFATPLEFGNVTSDDIGWGAGGPRLAWYDGPGFYYESDSLAYVRAEQEWIDDLPAAFAVLSGVGVAAYAPGTDLFVLDRLGLADSFTAHLEPQPALPGQISRFAGHEKPLPSPWIAARVTPVGVRPDDTIFPPFGSPMIPVTTGQEFQEQVAWARAALECDSIVSLLESVQEPMSVGRFASNFVGSASRARLRIPPDPEQAYRKFCGDDTPAEVVEIREHS